MSRRLENSLHHNFEFNSIETLLSLMDAEENNLNQGVAKVTEVLNLVHCLIGDIGRDNLSEVEANVKLVNTCERLLELSNDLEEI